MNIIDKTLKNIMGNKSFGGKNDLDFDGVPNRKDCQPRNTMRQDANKKLFNLDNFTRDFFIKRFNRTPESDPGYYREWRNRLSTIRFNKSTLGDPLRDLHGIADKQSMKVIVDLIKIYDI